MLVKPEDITITNDGVRVKQFNKVFRHIKEVTLQMTNNCNLACSYCLGNKKTGKT